MFEYTTAVDKMRGMTKRKKIVQGGTYAGKTHGIIPILIDKAAREHNIKITVVAETIPSVKDGAVDILKQVMQETGRWVDEHWSSNPMVYTFSNGSRMEFKSFQTVGKAKAAGKRDVLFINEANHIPYDIADALMIRSQDIWVDFNPDKEFWVHTEILDDPDSEFLKLTYRDNEAIPQNILDDLMLRREKAKTSTRWAHWCRVYLDGDVGIPYVENRFALDWEDETHIKTCWHKKEYPLYISMDFNIDPFAFIFYQIYQDAEGWHLWVFDEATIKAGTIGKAVGHIKKKFTKADMWRCVITGDYNGNKREMSQADHASNFEQIRRELQIKPKQIQTSSNPRHVNSRNDLNYVLYHSGEGKDKIDFRVDPRCENTIRDMRFVEANGEGGIVKSNRKELHQLADHMDAVRYAINHKDVMKWIRWRQKMYI